MSAPDLAISGLAVEAPTPRWATLLLTREPGTALALFRAAIGLCVLISLGSVIAHRDVVPLWLAPVDGGYTPPSVGWLFQLLGGVDPLRVHAVLAMAMGAGALLVAGLGGRISAAIALIGYGAIVHLDFDAGGSYDALLTNALWLLVLADSTATLSLDCRIREGRWVSARTVSAWPRWLALYQLVLVYFSTGLQKVSDTWVPGGELSAVYYVMQQPTWQRLDMHFLAHVFPLTQMATLLVWLFEVTSPLLLLAIHLEARGTGRVSRLLRRMPFRRVWAGFGLSFHLGIALSMALGAFPYLAMAFYFALLTRPETRRARPSPDAPSMLNVDSA